MRASLYARSTRYPLPATRILSGAEAVALGGTDRVLGAYPVPATEVGYRR